MNALNQAMFSEATHSQPLRIPPPERAKRRRKLWELPENLHCPVVGTCLPMTQLRRFAKRFDFEGPRDDDYRLHTEAVVRTMEREPFAQALQRYFEQEFATTIKAFQQANSDEAVVALWRQYLDRGEVAAAMWAALTHKAAGSFTRHRIHGDIHMLSHQVGAGQAADARRLEYLERQHREQRQALDQQRKEAAREQAALRDRIQALENENSVLRSHSEQVRSLGRELEAYRNGERQREMQTRIETLERENRKLLQRFARLEAVDRDLQDAREAVARLSQQRDQLQQERDALSRLLQNEECAQCDTQTCDLGKEETLPRSVLCVGGRTALLAHYRNLAERAGVELIYHDGGQEDALSRLPELLSSADAVLCPTDCVSHSAYHCVKRQCRRRGTPCLFYRGSGVSGFSLALSKLAKGDASLGPGPTREQ
jgi:hypothetical protein